MRLALRFAALGALLFAVLHGRSPLPRAAGQGEGEGRATDEDVVLARAAAALDLARGDAVIARRLRRNAEFLGAPADPGLAGSDLVVQRRLASRLRLAIEAGARAAEPSDDELRAWIAAHPGRFALPARLRVTQVFFSRDRRGAALAADAERARARLRAGDAVAGDPLPLPAALPSLSAAELASLLGEAVASAAAAAPIGEWSAPVASPFGLHLLRVESRQTPPPAALDAVRAAAREELLAARAAAALAAALRELRAGG